MLNKAILQNTNKIQLPGCLEACTEAKALIGQRDSFNSVSFFYLSIIITEVVMNNFVKNKKQFFAYLAKQIIKENSNVIIPYREALGKDIRQCYISSLDFYKSLRNGDSNEIKETLLRKKEEANKLFENHNIVWPF